MYQVTTLESTMKSCYKKMKTAEESVNDRDVYINYRGGLYHRTMKEVKEELDLIP